MQVSNQLTLPNFFEATVSKFKNRPAMSLVGGAMINYEELDSRIKSLMNFFERLGIEPGDRVAILSSNMPNWGITYYATTFMKAVVVPILPDFHLNEIETILKHSGARMLFVSDNLLSRFSSLKETESIAIIRIDLLVTQGTFGGSGMMVWNQRIRIL